MTVKGGTTPACAACKFQRRKCTPNCPLAPYFPANQPKMFQNVHRLFGVSNITKTLNSLKTKDQKEDAMKSIIYEAEMRERFPVYGCSVIIRQLDLQLQYAIEELRCVYAHLSALRAQSSGQVMVETGDTTSVLIHSPSVVGNDMAAFAHNTTTNNQFLINDSSFYGDSLDYLGKPLLGMDSSLGNSLTAIQSQMDALNILQQDRGIFPNDFEGVSFNSRIEERSYIDDTREVFESTSSESSLKNDSTIRVGQLSNGEQLKTAAAGFSLTQSHSSSHSSQLTDHSIRHVIPSPNERF